MSLDSAPGQKSDQDLKASFEARTETLIQSIKDFKKEVSDLKRIHAEESKRHDWEWAMANANIGAFHFFKKDGRGYTSTEFVQHILLSFRRGGGHFIAERLEYHPYTDAAKIESEEKKFRDAIVNQIHGLTGVKPQIVMGKDGYAIIES